MVSDDGDDDAITSFLLATLLVTGWILVLDFLQKLEGVDLLLQGRT
jgi:hypothetical protein